MIYSFHLFSLITLTATPGYCNGILKKSFNSEDKTPPSHLGCEAYVTTETFDLVSCCILPSGNSRESTYGKIDDN